MGGVDRVDQHLADYSLPAKERQEILQKLFFHLLDLALWNSFIVYRKCGGNKSALVYRMDLIQQIMEKYHQTEFSCRRGRPSANLTPLRLTGRHFPEYIPATEKKKNPTRQCGICSRVRDARGKKSAEKLAITAQIVICHSVLLLVLDNVGLRTVLPEIQEERIIGYFSKT
ncbi:hypothetical protein NQ318_020683 [Aromia moschata]|uniref:PiggyBac transposable element-derived protein domain-containing protein n=1 Tax=Aromia moschata TaxID=1265417 RepID=A0AAV8X0X0_9CUCU|nr:hypothetical protein NQ318_020683 [Aromia moschata]